MSLLLPLVILVAAVAGFSISTYISRKKQAPGPMLCPIGSDCASVVHSEYSRFLGIPLEYFGLLYYGMIACAYATPVWGFAHTPVTTLILITISSSALLFSLYLTAIQAFALRQWCTWCLTSAALSTIIFSASLANSQFGFAGLLAENVALFDFTFRLALATGVGVATAASILLFRFLSDFHVNTSEGGIMRILLQIIWLSLAVLVLSGTGLLLSAIDTEGIPPFLGSAPAIICIIAASVLLHFLCMPQLRSLSSKAGGRVVRNLRRVMFGLGAAILVSWYFIFLLSMEIAAVATFLTSYMAYAAFVFAALLASQVYETLSMPSLRGRS